MPVLHLQDGPNDVYERLQELAEVHHRTLEAEALSLLRRGLLPEMANRSQAELLADLRRRSFTPPPGTPDTVDLLREDRER
jgi:plasmid stability protein